MAFPICLPMDAAVRYGALQGVAFVLVNAQGFEEGEKELIMALQARGALVCDAPCPSLLLHSWAVILEPGFSYLGTTVIANPASINISEAARFGCVGYTWSTVAQHTHHRPLAEVINLLEFEGMVHLGVGRSRIRPFPTRSALRVLASSLIPTLAREMADAFGSSLACRSMVPELWRQYKNEDAMDIDTPPPSPKRVQGVAALPNPTVAPAMTVSSNGMDVDQQAFATVPNNSAQEMNIDEESMMNNPRPTRRVAANSVASSFTTRIAPAPAMQQPAIAAAIPTRFAPLPQPQRNTIQPTAASRFTPAATVTAQQPAYSAFNHNPAPIASTSAFGIPVAPIASASAPQQQAPVSAFATHFAPAANHQVAHQAPATSAFAPTIAPAATFPTQQQSTAGFASSIAAPVAPILQPTSGFAKSTAPVALIPQPTSGFASAPAPAAFVQPMQQPIVAGFASAPAPAQQPIAFGFASASGPFVPAQTAPAPAANKVPGHPYGDIRPLRRNKRGPAAAPAPAPATVPNAFQVPNANLIAALDAAAAPPAGPSTSTAAIPPTTGEDEHGRELSTQATKRSRLAKAAAPATSSGSGGAAAAFGVPTPIIAAASTAQPNQAPTPTQVPVPAPAPTPAVPVPFATAAVNRPLNQVIASNNLPPNVNVVQPTAHSGVPKPPHGPSPLNPGQPQPKRNGFLYKPPAREVDPDEAEVANMLGLADVPAPAKPAEVVSLSEKWKNKPTINLTPGPYGKPFPWQNGPEARTVTYHVTSPPITPPEPGTAGFGTPQTFPIPPATAVGSSQPQPQGGRSITVTEPGPAPAHVAPAAPAPVPSTGFGGGGPAPMPVFGAPAAAPAPVPFTGFGGGGPAPMPVFGASAPGPAPAPAAATASRPAAPTFTQAAALGIRPLGSGRPRSGNNPIHNQRMVDLKILRATEARERANAEAISNSNAAHEANMAKYGAKPPQPDQSGQGGSGSA